MDEDLLPKAGLPDALRLNRSLAADNLNTSGDALQNGRRLGDDVTDVLCRTRAADFADSGHGGRGGDASLAIDSLPGTRAKTR